MDSTSSSAWRKSTYSSSNGGGCIEVGTVPWRKSTHSSGNGGACVEVGTAPWRKSTHSSANGGGCVETGTAAGAVLIRDTTNRAAGAIRVSPAAFRDLVARIRANPALT